MLGEKKGEDLCHGEDALALLHSKSATYSPRLGLVCLVVRLSDALSCS